jgi:hypothetical protein
MSEALKHNFADFFPLFFPVFFIAMWLAVTTLLSFVSGWFALMQRYPDQKESPILRLKGLSGSLGFVGMRSILNISVCPSGLRLGMMRIFGPFSRPFFIPWNDLQVTRTQQFFQKVAKISLGQPKISTLTLSSHIADRLARAAPQKWPEHGSFPPETSREAATRIFKEWLFVTLIAAAFFTFAPRIMAPNGAAPPVVVAILFPAIVFGIASLIRYLARPRG